MAKKKSGPEPSDRNGSEVENARNQTAEYLKKLNTANERLTASEVARNDSRIKLENAEAELKSLRAERQQAQELIDRESRIALREQRAEDLAAQCADAEKNIVSLRLEHRRLLDEIARSHATLNAGQSVLDTEIERLEAREKAVAQKEMQLAERQQQHEASVALAQSEQTATRQCLEVERLRWESAAEARRHQAEADERGAQAVAIRDAQKRCEELKAAARREYDAFIALAQQRATELVDVARTQHELLIAAAGAEVKQLRQAYEKEREERDRVTAAETTRRLERAQEEAARIEALAAAAQADVQRIQDEHALLLVKTREKERECERVRAELETLKAAAERRQTRLTQEIENAAAAEIQRLSVEITARDVRIEAIEKQLQEQIVKRQELELHMLGSGKETIPRLKKQLEEVRARVAELEQEQREAPRKEDLGRLRESAAQAATHERIAAELRQRVAQLEYLRAVSESNNLEHEGERKITETLRATNQAMRQELDVLKTLVQQQVPNPLRAFQDVYERVQRPVGEVSAPERLGQLAQGVRHRMAALPNGRKRFYSEKVVATYLAALASTRTVLLEGLSGTGKTSLPIAVAEAMGASYEVIEVQSQWRDRGDLIGSYNPFHKRFYAQPFALALYKAGLPGFRERPFFIILDELNLSHVEHYFADLLSRLQRDASEHRLRLADDPEALAGTQFSAGLIQDPHFGLVLEIPPNVWFIGTANRDESTRPISDKVYDRAIMIELNRRAEAFLPDPRLELLEPVGFTALNSLFAAAQGRSSDAEKAVKRCLDEVVGFLEQKVSITRTNRFEEQWKRFLPVYLGAYGESAKNGVSQQRIGEALDHFVATKLLRPLKERFDPNLDEILKSLRDDALPMAWDEKAWGEFHKTQCHILLSQQLARCQSGGAT